jgi:hypothetical protein
MQTRSSLQHRPNSESNNPLAMTIKPRPWGQAPQAQAPQAVQRQPGPYSWRDMVPHDPSPRPAPNFLQAKLTVGAPNDVYEQEADRVAEQVMSMPDTKPAVQREGMPEEEEDLQAKALGGSIQREVMPAEEEVIQAKLIQREAMPEEEECSVCDQKDSIQAPLLQQVKLGNSIQLDPADSLDDEHNPQSASAILSQLNPPVMKNLGEYCNTNCPATASAVSHYLATGEIKAAHCNKLADDQGYDVSDNEFTKSMKWQQANGFINPRTSKHGSFVVVEGDRGDKPPEGLTRWHYFVIVNIRGERFVVDAFRSGQITSSISSYVSSLKTKLYKLVKGEFKVTPVRRR